MRIPVDGPTDSPGRTGPGFDTGKAAIDGPSDQPVDRHCGISPHVSRWEPDDVPPRSLTTSPRTPASEMSTLEPPPMTDWHCSVAREKHSLLQLGGRLQRQQPVSVAAHFERRQRRERRVALDALTEQFPQPAVEMRRHHFGRPVSRRSCTRSASRAAGRVQATNSTQSPGAS